MCKPDTTYIGDELPTFQCDDEDELLHVKEEELHCKFCGNTIELNASNDKTELILRHVVGHHVAVVQTDNPELDPSRLIAAHNILREP